MWTTSKIQPLIASFKRGEPLRFPPPKYNLYQFEYQRSNNKLRYPTYFHFSDIIKRAQFPLKPIPKKNNYRRSCSQITIL